MLDIELGQLGEKFVPFDPRVEHVLFVFRAILPKLLGDQIPRLEFHARQHCRELCRHHRRGRNRSGNGSHASSNRIG